jgi:hypothetical protein
MRLLFALPLLLLFSDALAMPALRLTWDDCNAVALDQSWSGPGPYTLVVSGVGFAGPYSHLSLVFAFTPQRVAPAWDMSTFDYWGGTPCQGPTRLVATVGGGSCPAYPATSRTAEMGEGSLTQPGQTILQVQLALDPFFGALQSQRYEFVKLVFDHTNSVTGPGGAGTCGFADAPMCVNIAFATLNLAGGESTSYTYERSYVTWQDPTNSRNCPGGATPAQAKTWGAIKDQYR